MGDVAVQDAVAKTFAVVVVIVSAYFLALLWAVGCGLWAVSCVLWAESGRLEGILYCGLCAVSCGLWAVSCGLWALSCGLWVVSCGHWALSRGLEGFLGLFYFQ